MPNKDPKTYIVSDQATEIDSLDFAPYVETLADIIQTGNTPLTIGIFGTWGSGKTSLMRMIKNGIPGTEYKGLPSNYAVVWFDAWKYDKEETLWRVFLLSVLAQIKEAAKKNKEPLDALEYLETMLYRAVDIERAGGVNIDLLRLGGLFAKGTVQLALSFIPGGAVLSKFVEEVQKSGTKALTDDFTQAIQRERTKIHIEQVRFLEQFQDKFNGLIKQYIEPNRLVIFVDDLDRCLPEKAIEVLEAIKLFLDSENCVFVLGLDQEVIAQGIEMKYKELGARQDVDNQQHFTVEGMRYLEKIIQLPFQIPPVEQAEMGEFVNALSSEWPHEECPKVFAEGLGDNPRQIKRTVNSFLMLWKLAFRRKLHERIKPIRLAKVVAIQTVFPELYALRLKVQPRYLQELEKYFRAKVAGPSGMEETENDTKTDVNTTLVEPPGTLLPFLSRKEASAVRRILTFHQPDFEDANFEGLELDELKLYFTLTRRAEAPQPTAFVEEVLSQPQLSDIAKAEPTTLAGTISPRPQSIDNETPVIRSLHQLPPPPSDFKGRDELITQLVADLRHGDGATITGRQPQGLVGMGGIGKTALGLVVAHRIADDYLDAQIFLDLRGTTEPLSATEIMRHVVLTFEPGADLKAIDEAGMKNAYYTVLHNKRALLFFDNARSAEQVAPLRPPETCAMLVTSRWNFPVTGLKSHRLDVLNEEDAKALLLDLCPRIGDHASGLAKACGYLPLALRIAGSFLQVNESWDVAKYLDDLNDRRNRLTTLKRSHTDAELTAEPELLASFEGSYNQLSEEDQKRWWTLGVFPLSFDSKAAGALWELDDEGTMRLLNFLCRYSLLDPDPTADRYSLHDLLTDYARSQMDEGEEFEARLRHAVHYKDVLSAANDLYLEGSENVLTGLRLFDSEWENIRAGQAWAVTARADNPDARRLCMDYPIAGIYVLDLRQHPRERIEWLEAALSAARELGERRGEGQVLSDLGVAYADLGETRKAIEFYEQVLVIFRETGDRRGEGQDLGNLGLAYANLGEMRKAIEYHEGHLAITRETGDRRGEGNALTNLGTAYAALGETRKAIEYHEQALVIYRETGDRRGEGSALNNLGVAYADLGETRKAIEFYEQALVIYRETGDRRGEGIALGSLGNAYYILGEINKAIEYYEGQLVIARETSDRRGEGNACFNMGLALYDLGEKDRAIAMMKQALEIREAIEDPWAENARDVLKQWEAIE